MTRVIHTGDTHIGYRQYHSPDRQQDFLDALGSVVTDAIDLDVDAVVHAGDLFHDTRPAIPTLVDTVELLRELSGAEIPFLGVVGNHEGTRDRQWLDLFSDLELATRLDSTGVEIGNVTFYGQDWVPPASRDELSYSFAPPTTDYAALVGHGLFEPFAHADWDTQALLERSTVDFDVLLLGDNHTPGRVEIDTTWLTYCGSTERASASEREERGYNLVNFEEEMRITRRQVANTRQFIFIDIDLAPGEGIDRIIDEATSHDVTDAVVIISVTGEGDDVSPAVVETAIEDAGALVTRISDAREVQEASYTAVSFADPDRAIAQRLSALALSPAGEMVDDLIRDETIPDATVRERVRDRVETLLTEQGGAFERTEPPEEATEPADGDSAQDQADEPGVDVADPAPESSSMNSQRSIVDF